MNVTIKCPMCSKLTILDITEQEYLDVQSGVSVQEACPTRDVFFRETLISHLCYDCQSKAFHKPKPGEDWGELLGECECCGYPVYVRDKGICVQCGTAFTATDDVCYESDKCECKTCDACDDATEVIREHVCKCRACKVREENK